MSGEILLYSLILLMVGFWSGNYIAGKLALRDFPPLLLISLRLFFAGLMILPIYWRERWRSPEQARVSWSDWPALLSLGILGLSLNQVLFVVGLSLTSVAHSALIVGLIPIMVLLLATLLGQEHITLRKTAGMIVALAGVAILKVFEGRQQGGPTWLGDCIIFLSTLTFSIFTVFGKRATKRYSAVVVNTFGYVGGGLTLLPVILWGFARFPYGQVRPLSWACLLYMALFPSVLAYLIYYYALKRIPASRVSAFSYLQPVLAMTMGVFILGERVTGSLLLGGTVIFSGVYLTERG
ncbi:MAG TPA: DMT family transporter [Bryobacteraceae bacterium]|nr:DMT family transporter [Bryobacteraceae bacterium]